MSADTQFSNTAPRDFLSPEYPRSGGVIYDMSAPGNPRPGYDPLAVVSDSLRINFGVRAWLAWMADDGFLRFVARTRP